jgi:hypothetical protein
MNLLFYKSPFLTLLSTCFQDDSRISIKHSKSERGYAVIELQIGGLTPKDTNNYTCSAKNNGGSQEWEKTITVQCKYIFVLGQATYLVTIAVRCF